MGLYSTRRVPLEICELIIDEVKLLDNKKFSALKACALTCRDFVHPARRHLFYSVYLNYYSDFSIIPYKCLEAAFLSSPEIALYIREFRIHSHFHSPDIDRYGLHTEPMLPSILGMLKNLTTFGVYSSIGDPIYWEDFTHELKQALGDIFVSPKLVHLDLDGIEGIPSTYAKFIKQTITVKLIDVGFSIQSEDHRELETDSIEQKGGLKHLTISDMEISRIQPLLEILLDPDCKLEALRLESCSESSVEAAQDIMRRTKETLTTFECISFDSVDEDFEGINNVNIGTLSRLQSIKVLVDFGREDPFTYVRQILSTAWEENEIQDVIFEFCFEVPTQIASSSSHDWIWLDSTLTGPKLAKLQNVAFTFEPYMIRRLGKVTPEGIESLKLLFRDFLPTAREKGVLQLGNLGL